MGITNVHHASQILQCAGSEKADQALLADFGKYVLLVGRGFEQEEIDTFAEVLHTPHRDRWVEYNKSDVPKVVPIDRQLVPIPTLYTSPGLKDDGSINLRFDKPKDANGETIELVYVIVVRGPHGALFSKVRVFYSRFAVAAGIMEEALQGFCVVFSAAMLKRDVKRLGQDGVRFAKMESLRGLITSVDQETAADVILLCC